MCLLFKIELLYVRNIQMVWVFSLMWFHILLDQTSQPKLFTDIEFMEKACLKQQHATHQKAFHTDVSFHRRISLLSYYNLNNVYSETQQDVLFFQAMGSWRQENMHW